MAKKKFYIAKIEEDVEEKEQEIEERREVVREKEEPKKFQSEQFVSSFHGRQVKDVSSFPYVRFGNKGSQYENFREKRLETDEELERKHGTKYYEFNQILGRRPKEEVIETSKSTMVVSKAIADHETNVITDESYYEDDYQENNSYEQEEVEDIYTPMVERGEFEESSRLIDEERAARRAGFIQEERVPRRVEVAHEEPKIIERVDTSHIKTTFPNKKRTGKYIAPPINLLRRGRGLSQTDYSSVNQQKNIIDETLKDFRIGGRVVHYTRGPAVTQFEIRLDPGVKVERIKGISGNLQMNLEGKSIRIEAPIPGKSTIGVEVPNVIQDTVFLGDLLSRNEFLKDDNPLNVVLGIDISGAPVDLDITTMPHALVAGSTGSGKSVCINTIITSIIYKATPDQVKLILIDPKLIEFSAYEDIPHLATPVINDPKLATAALKWAVDEMQNRYELFRAHRRRDIVSYNTYARESGYSEIPYIVIIIDELADLMYIASSSVEEYIQRLAQKARASGIHLIMATQRPSTDVIKGTIKANMQTRIAFAVSSQVDSMTILDKSGADKLLGKGDMLYLDGVNETRVQGAFISLDEILAVTDYIKENYGPKFMLSKEELTSKMEQEDRSNLDGESDELFSVIAKNVVETDNASINRIQREYQIGFNRAQNLIFAMERLGIVSEGLAGRPRTVLVTMEGLIEILEG